MSTINYVSPETFAAIIAKRDEAAALRRKLKNPNLSLAQKIDLQRQAKAAENEMYALTKE